MNGDDDVGDGGDQGEGSHGTATLSVLGGFQPGQLVGPAFGASFILAKTENTDSETPVEEDNWAAAAEWAEALGADVISSSLGYLTYDSPFPSYTFLDMNGETAISTRAADGGRGARRGGRELGGQLRLRRRAQHAGRARRRDAGHRRRARWTRRGSRAFFSSVGPTADGRIKPDVAAQGVAVKAASPPRPAATRWSTGRRSPARSPPAWSRSSSRRTRA